MQTLVKSDWRTEFTRTVASTTKYCGTIVIICAHIAQWQGYATRLSSLLAGAFLLVSAASNLDRKETPFWNVVLHAVNAAFFLAISVIDYPSGG